MRYLLGLFTIFSFFLFCEEEVISLESHESALHLDDENYHLMMDRIGEILNEYSPDPSDVLDTQIKNSLTEPLILVNTTLQRLYLVESGTILNSYPVSTSKNGLGQEDDSFMTPVGLHRVHDKIGEGAEPLAIFKSRVLTGDIAIVEKGGTSIVARILRLQGLEEGFNRGTNLDGKLVDSYERYIYIHGTNNVEEVGMPVSTGCIRMVPSDVIDLFDKVSEGSIVYIY